MDELDLAQEREQIFRDSAIAQTAREIPQGTPGDCEWCELNSPRLVRGACAVCRDAFRLDLVH